MKKSSQLHCKLIVWCTILPLANKNWPRTLIHFAKMPILLVHVPKVLILQEWTSSLATVHILTTLLTLGMQIAVNNVLSYPEVNNALLVSYNFTTSVVRPDDYKHADDRTVPHKTLEHPTNYNLDKRRTFV